MAADPPMVLSHRRDRIFRVWGGRGAACGAAELSQGVPGTDPASSWEILHIPKWAQPRQGRVPKACWVQRCSQGQLERRSRSPRSIPGWIPAAPAHPSRQPGLVLRGHSGIFQTCSPSWSPRCPEAPNSRLTEHCRGKVCLWFAESHGPGTALGSSHRL